MILIVRACRDVTFERVMLWTAWAELVAMAVLTPLLFFWLAKDEPAAILALSIYAIWSTALGRISSGRADKKLGEAAS